MDIIKVMINRGYITPAKWRSIESFIVWLFFSFSIGLLSWLTDILSGKDFDFGMFVVSFVTTSLIAVTMWVQKHLRDKQKKLLDSQK